MPKIVESILTRIKLPQNITEKERRYYYIGLLTSLFPLFFHLGLTIFFWLVDVKILAAANILSVAVYVYTLYSVLAWGKYLRAIIIGAIEVLVLQFIFVVGLGWNAGFQYYLVAYILAIGLLPPQRRFIIVTFELLYGLTYFLLDVFLKQNTPIFPLDPVYIVALNTVNVLIFLSLLTLGMIYFIWTVLYAEDKAEAEYQRAESLLLNILPASVAQRLKDGATTIADTFDDVTVLFADLVGFTKMSAHLEARETVNVMNRVFTLFDEIAERYQLEKIKTIGDSYMVVAGAPDPCKDHAERVVRFALDAVRALDVLDQELELGLRIRIGVNSGPAVGGVIGKKKFIYDLWGVAVNLASRMESHGIPGQIQVGEATYQILKDAFLFEDRGLIEVKGIGPVRAYILRDVRRTDENKG